MGGNDQLVSRCDDLSNGSGVVDWGRLVDLSGRVVNGGRLVDLSRLVYGSGYSEFGSVRLGLIVTHDALGRDGSVGVVGLR